MDQKLRCILPCGGVRFGDVVTVIDAGPPNATCRRMRDGHEFVVSVEELNQRFRSARVGTLSDQVNCHEQGPNPEGSLDATQRARCSLS